MDRKVRERRRLVNRERGRRRAGLIFLCLLAVAAAALFLWLRSSSVFAVEEITAPVTKHVTQDQIAEAVASARGVSLLKLSTRDIEESLSQLPYVRAIHVYRKFPNTLDIRMEEYEPVARVRSGDGKTWLVADDGRLLEKIALQAASSLPLVFAAAEFQTKAGEILPADVAAALPVARMIAAGEVPSSLPALDHISVAAGGEVVVHLDGGTELRLGEPVDLKQKITDAAGIIHSYLRDGKALEYVDASAAGRLAVKAK